ncbi:MAG: hypothetical protein RIC35_22750 [Marinoscillum sp.]
MKNTSFPFLCVLILLICCEQKNEQSIDRKALVTRHIVKLDQPDTLASLSVGNGDFAFTVDVSGLQSFYKEYEKGVSLGTQSQWAWHSIPVEEHFTFEDVAQYDTSCTGQVIPFAVQHSEGRKGRATHALRTNPHRLHMGIIGLELLKENGEKAKLEDLKAISQTLDPWTGKIESTYEIEGVPVKVELFGHQEEDAIAANIISPLIDKGRLKVFLKFPYGSDCHVCPGYDWEAEGKHQTTLESESDHGVVLRRTLDTTIYFTAVNWTGTVEMAERSKHDWVLDPTGESFSFSVGFAPTVNGSIPNYSQTAENSITSWKTFWEKGGAIDFSECTDPRAFELERRVVLSQYLTKIQCAGELPPQETGLTMNSWYGKFHLEMHWWHVVHFALWDRLSLLERSMDWYEKVMPRAREIAAWQGFDGVRWVKMTGPNGQGSPSGVGEYLVWQEPHPIYYAELIYRQKQDQETLERYKDRVFQTADFMADYVQQQPDGFYHLCAPLKPAQELFPAMETNDPPFELSYWHYALSVAQKWRERLGLEPREKWQQVVDKLAPLAIKDGLYLPTASHTTAYEDDFYRRDHPVVLGSLGMLPASDRIDPGIMQATYDEIQRSWQWQTTWGWDYPMLAMCAARLGNPDQAVDALFMDLQKNTYLPNGHNYQDDRLRIYLPGNGGLLTAVAMMAAGWDGSGGETPGFPDDGTWAVKWEGLKRMP